LLKYIGIGAGAVSVVVLGASVSKIYLAYMAKNAACAKAHMAAHQKALAKEKLENFSNAMRAGVGESGVATGTCAGVATLDPLTAVGVGAATAVIVAAGYLEASRLASTKALAAAKTLANAQVAAATVAQSSAGTLAVFQPVAITSGIIVALFPLGYMGRDKVKAIWGKLWTKEIELHLQTAKAFEIMEQHLSKVAEQLCPTKEKNYKLLHALDLVRETAQELAEGAEVAKNLHPPAGLDAERSLERHVQELSNLVDKLREQTQDLLPTVTEMQAYLDPNRLRSLPGSLSLADGQNQSEVVTMMPPTSDDSLSVTTDESESISMLPW
jgi:hypothetical protein